MFIEKDIETGESSALFDFMTEPCFTPHGKIAFPASVHTLSKSCVSICVSFHFEIRQSVYLQ